MTYRDTAAANDKFNTYIFYTLFAELTSNEQARQECLELAQEAYKEYRKIRPDEELDAINEKAKLIREKFLKEVNIYD